MKDTRANNRWQSLKPHVQRQWKWLTDEDIAGIDGNLERLLDILCSRLGYNRLFAERAIARWRRELLKDEALPRA